MDRVLILENDQDWQGILSKALSDRLQVHFWSGGRDLPERLRKEVFEVIILDIRPDQLARNDFLKTVKSRAAVTPIIVTSQTGEPELVVKAIRDGAFDFVPKPYTPEKIRLTVAHALENRSMKNEIDYLRREQDIIYDWNRIVADSPAMKKVIATVKKLANTDSTLLMTGETGTGKSFLSGTIHFNSHRKQKPFIKVNCANIPETLLESELFGHERGAFTDAKKMRVGRFEQANGGTVFLDEIGELSLPLQAKLLRVLEERCFERLGGNQTIYSDIRIIAATNRNVEEMVARGTLREDLYYRINVIRVHLPPLRERPQCFDRIAEYLLVKNCRNIKKYIKGFSPGALKLLKQYNWPGNIRQLSNTIERAVLLEETQVIQEESISLPHPIPVREETVQEPIPRTQDLKKNERDLILTALEKSLWIQKDAADLLGITPRALNYKIKKFGISHHRWRKNK
ncbi:MAG: sigma-54-dependent Fis family transcriptional regulator [Deltaproteobacteria bacterium]|nr:sigma-54-dependent Fis family transcriptional regulator [Deltaproteobacteria bacterium]